jgi:hypothetical protein
LARAKLPSLYVAEHGLVVALDPICENICTCSLNLEAMVLLLLLLLLILIFLYCIFWWILLDFIPSLPIPTFWECKALLLRLCVCCRVERPFFEPRIERPG